MTYELISASPSPNSNDIPEDLRTRMLDVQQKAGFIPNVFLTLAHRPDECRAFFAYHDALMLKETPALNKAEREMIVVTTSGANDCVYCVVAHGAILRVYTKNPRIADQVAINHRKAEITPKQRAMLDFALKVCLHSNEIDEPISLRCARTGSPMTTSGISVPSQPFGMSNRLANASSMRPNDEFYLMGRLPRQNDGDSVPDPGLQGDTKQCNTPLSSRYSQHRATLCAVALLLTPRPTAVPALAQDVKGRNNHHQSRVGQATLAPVRTSAAYPRSTTRAVPTGCWSASADVAKETQLYSMITEAGVMKMREVKGIDVAANIRPELKPGGFHIMLVGLADGLKEGTKFPLKLKFEKAGEVTVQVTAESRMLTVMVSTSIDVGRCMRAGGRGARWQQRCWSASLR